MSQNGEKGQSITAEADRMWQRALTQSEGLHVTGVNISRGSQLTSVGQRTRMEEARRSQWLYQTLPAAVPRSGYFSSKWVDPLPPENIFSSVFNRDQASASKILLQNFLGN